MATESASFCLVRKVRNFNGHMRFLHVIGSWVLGLNDSYPLMCMFTDELRQFIHRFAALLPDGEDETVVQSDRRGERSQHQWHVARRGNERIRDGHPQRSCRQLAGQCAVGSFEADQRRRVELGNQHA